jgi:hypothetical protein
VAAPAPARTSGTAPEAPAASPSPAATSASGGGPADLKDSFLNQIKSTKVFFYNTVVANAYRVDVTSAKITFTFLANQKVPKQQCEDMRPWLESIAERVAGKKIAVAVVVADAPTANASGAPAASEKPRATEDELRHAAMADPGVQALLEIFPVENTKVDEI